MKTLETVLPSVNRSLTESREKTGSSEPMTASSSDRKKSEIAQRFWMRMTELYGSAWCSQAGEKPSKLWSDILASISPQVIGQAIALAARSGSKFPPHLPEFADLCQRAAGFPSADQAYRDAANARWTHPVVFETCRRVGQFELRRSSERDMLPRWRAAYADVCAEAMAGKTFEAPKVERIERKAPEPATPERAKAALDAMMAMLGGAA